MIKKEIKQSWIFFIILNFFIIFGVLFVLFFSEAVEKKMNYYKSNINEINLKYASFFDSEDLRESIYEYNECLSIVRNILLTTGILSLLVIAISFFYTFFKF